MLSNSIGGPLGPFSKSILTDEYAKTLKKIDEM